MSLKLYWNKVCPFVHRAWIAAVEKNVAVQLVHVPLDTMPEWYKKINPRETVPTLEHDGKLIFESGLIAQYLDDAFEPKQSLFPGSAYDRHRIKFFQEQVGEFVGAAYTSLMDPSNADAAKECKAQIANLESILQKQSTGPFFLGSTFSLADIHLVPFLDRFRYTLPAYTNTDIFENAPRLKALMDAAMLRPSVFSTAQPASYYIESYQSYAKKDATVAKHTLYAAKVCPYCDRVKLAAAAKGVALNVVMLELGALPEWYTKYVNPRGTVPALSMTSGEIVHESTLIAEFLDNDAPATGPRLVPQDANGRYAINMFLETASGFTPAAFAFLRSKGADAEAKSEFVSVCKAISEAFTAQNAEGPFFFGSNVSLADAAFLPLLARVEACLAVYTPDFKLANEFPRLKALLDAAKKHEALGPIFQDPAIYVEAWQSHGFLPKL